jgi:pyruvate formate lyase activating enzyme
MSKTERRDDAESGGAGVSRLSRRTLLKAGLGAAIGVGYVAGVAKLGSGARPEDSSLPARGTQDLWRHPASHFEKRPKKHVRCVICPNHCLVARGGRGRCETRENSDGEYYTLVYGRAASVNIDPIEKKPLFHVLPGSPILSFATAGCNLECKNCQNWRLSQARPEALRAIHLPPTRLVEAAQEHGCSLIAGTYNEPTVFFEYLRDVAMEGNKRGLRTAMVSSGYIEKTPMLELCQELAAIKIDLKSMSDSFYRTNSEGSLQPVLDSIERVKSQGVWLEIVYLVIPTLNDSEKEITNLARWIKTHVGADTPLHFSRFHPAYRLTRLPPTPYETLDRCHEIARAEGLHYVYVGNVPGTPAQNTLCPKCGRELIRRQHFRIAENHVKQGRCEFCQQAIPGIWS